MNKVVAIGLSVGLLLLGSKLWSVKRLSDKSVVRTLNPRIHKVDISGIIVRTEVAVDNPTKDSITVTKPVITLTSSGKYLASSVPENKVYTIQPLAQTSLETAEITIPWTSLTGYMSSLVAKIPLLISTYNSTGKLAFSTLAIPLEYKYSTYVDGNHYESTPEKLV
jgi:hypothetical protein